MQRSIGRPRTGSTSLAVAGNLQSFSMHLMQCWVSSLQTRPSVVVDTLSGGTGVEVLLKVSWDKRMMTTLRMLITCWKGRSLFL